MNSKHIVISSYPLQNCVTFNSICWRCCQIACHSLRNNVAEQAQKCSVVWSQYECTNQNNQFFVSTLCFFLFPTEKAKTNEKCEKHYVQQRVLLIWNLSRSFSCTVEHAMIFPHCSVISATLVSTCSWIFKNNLLVVVLKAILPISPLSASNKTPLDHQTFLLSVRLKFFCWELL